jgi:hypothetical protein
MDRTRKLMSTITASVLLAGAQGVPSPALSASAVVSKQPTTQSEETWKKDPEVARVAEIIFEQLKGTDKEDALPMMAILADAPEVKPATAELGIKKLEYQNRIKRSGSGTKEDPYRWYEKSGQTV